AGLGDPAGTRHLVVVVEHDGRLAGDVAAGREGDAERVAVVALGKAEDLAVGRSDAINGAAVEQQDLAVQFGDLVGFGGVLPAEVEEEARGVDRRVETEIRSRGSETQAETSGERGQDERASLRHGNSPLWLGAKLPGP